MNDPIPAHKTWTVLYLIFGVLIGLPMLAIVIAKLPLFLDPAAAIADGVVAGTIAQAQHIRLMMLSLTVFAMTSLLYGLFRLFTGKRNQVFKLVMLAGAIYGLYEAYLLSKIM